MTKVPLITTASHRYNSVWLKAGDAFDADNETDASELICTGFARRPVGYNARVLTAQPATTSEPPRQKRKYQRRDLAVAK